MAQSLTRPNELVVVLKSLYADVSARLLHVLQVWEGRYRQRVELRRLMLMGPELIADIGMTMQEAEIEAGLPFWRPPQLLETHLRSPMSW